MGSLKIMAHIEKVCRKHILDHTCHVHHCYRYCLYTSVCIWVNQLTAALTGLMGRPVHVVVQPLGFSCAPDDRGTSCSLMGLFGAIRPKESNSSGI